MGGGVGSKRRKLFNQFQPINNWRYAKFIQTFVVAAGWGESPNDRIILICAVVLADVQGKRTRQETISIRD